MKERPADEGITGSPGHQNPPPKKKKPNDKKPPRHKHGILLPSWKEKKMHPWKTNFLKPPKFKPKRVTLLEPASMWPEEMHSSHASAKSSKVTWEKGWVYDSDAGVAVKNWVMAHPILPPWGRASDLGWGPREGSRRRVP